MDNGRTILLNYSFIDNFLDESYFFEIRDTILNNVNFPWYFIKGVANPDDKDFYFFHLVYAEMGINSDFYYLLEPLLNKLNIEKLIRIKINFYPKTENILRHGNHIDYDYPHKGCIFYLNTNNGKTILNNDVEIESIENRILFFNPNQPHCSTTCSDFLYRTNININYL